MCGLVVLCKQNSNMISSNSQSRKLPASQYGFSQQRFPIQRLIKTISDFKSLSLWNHEHPRMWIYRGSYYSTTSRLKLLSSYLNSYLLNQFAQEGEHFAHFEHITHHFLTIAEAYTKEHMHEPAWVSFLKPCVGVWKKFACFTSKYRVVGLQYADMCIVATKKIEKKSKGLPDMRCCR